MSKKFSEYAGDMKIKEVMKSTKEMIKNGSRLAGEEYMDASSVERIKKKIMNS